MVHRTARRADFRRLSRYGCKWRMLQANGAKRTPGRTLARPGGRYVRQLGQARTDCGFRNSSASCLCLESWSLESITACTRTAAASFRTGRFRSRVGMSEASISSSSRLPSRPAGCGIGENRITKSDQAFSYSGCISWNKLPAVTIWRPWLRRARKLRAAPTARQPDQ